METARLTPGVGPCFPMLKRRQFLCASTLAAIGGITLGTRAPAADPTRKRDPAVAPSPAPRSELPVAATVDVLVVGGSTGAVAAAVEAARGGAKVFLAAPRPYLGDDLCATLQLWREEDENPEDALAKAIYTEKGELAAPGHPVTPLHVKKTLDDALIDGGGRGTGFLALPGARTRPGNVPVQAGGGPARGAARPARPERARPPHAPRRARTRGPDPREKHRHHAAQCRPARTRPGPRPVPLRRPRGPGRTNVARLRRRPAQPLRPPCPGGVAGLGRSVANPSPPFHSRCPTHP